MKLINKEKMTQFLLRIEPTLLKRIENISPNKKTSEQIRTILKYWLDEKHPDVSEIEKKIIFHEQEIARLREAVLNAGNIRSAHQEELEDLDKLRREQEDKVLTMLYSHYVSDIKSDDVDHQKWMKWFKFDTKEDLFTYLSARMEECGGKEAIRELRHKQVMRGQRMVQIENLAKACKMSVDEFMAFKNIDIDAEMEILFKR